MNKKQILEIIKENPYLSYSEVKKHADEAGVSSKMLDEVWNDLGKEKIDHNKRVQEIKDEIGRLGKDAKTHKEWKKYFIGKGYLDDECDFGYALAIANIIYGPLHPKITIFLLIVIGISISVCLLFAWAIPEWEFEPFLISVFAGILPIFVYYLYLYSKFKKFFYKVVKTDFDAEEIDKQKFKNFKIVLNSSHDSSKSVFKNLLNLTYDDRETYFGDFFYSLAKGGDSVKYTYTVIIQKLKKSFPNVVCTRFGSDKYLINPFPIVPEKEYRSLEGGFNKKFAVWSKDPKDAFYVLNPRVMNKMVQEGVYNKMRIFEVYEDYLFIAFDEIKIIENFFSNHVYQYNNYQETKNKLLKFLDITSDLNDILSRQIVDNGEKRSIAKIK